MNEQLKKLLESLISKFNPHDLASNFELLQGYKALFAENIQVAENSKPLWMVLQQVFTLHTKWDEVNRDFQNCKALDSVRAKLKRDIENIEQARGGLSTKLKENEDSLQHSYDKVYQIYETIQQQQLAAISRPSSTSDRRNLVAQLRSNLVAQRDPLGKSDLRLRLYNNLKQRNKLIEKLKELKLIEVNMHLSNIVKSHRTQSEQLAVLKSTTDVLLDQLTLTISIAEAKNNIAKLDTEIEQYKRELDNINEQIDTVKATLRKETKKNAKRAYEEAEDKDDFMATEAIGTAVGQSRFNPFGFYNYWFDTNEYNKDIEELTNRNSYYNLLHKQFTTQKFIDQLQNRLEQFKKEQQNFPAESDDKPQSTVCEAVINHLNMQKIPITSMEPCILYDLLQENKEALAKQLDFYKEGFALFDEINTIDKENKALRTENSYLQTSSVDLKEDEITKLQEDAKAHKDTVKLLTSHIDTCTIYITIADEIDAQNAQLKQLNYGFMEETYNQLDNKLKTQNYPEAQQKQITNLEKDFEQLFTQLTALHDTIMLAEEQSTVEKIQPISNPFNDQLKAQYDETLALHALPQDLQEWYAALFAALSSQTRDQACFYQAAQLLRDIHFELQFPDKSGTFQILRSYYQCCKDPAKDYLALLAIKPAVPIAEEELIPLSNSILQARFDTLYQHQANMKDKHPREALLLGQATRNLQHLANQAQDNLEQGIDKVAVENLITDPRYECLQEHRGILKAVEYLAQLCTSFLSFIGCTEQSIGTYRQRFFFVPTYSLKLLAETAKEIQTEEYNFEVV